MTDEPALPVKVGTAVAVAALPDVKTTRDVMTAA